MRPLSCVLQLPRSCQTFKIRNGNKDQTIYIVGTAHVSAASCDDVRAVIRAVKPEVILQTSTMSAGWQNGQFARLCAVQVVVLELCSERRQILTMEKQDVSQSDMLAPHSTGLRTSMLT